MNAVHRLGHVGHGDFFGVTVKDVEGQAGVDGVAQSNGLAQDVTGRDLFAGFVPDSPLVNYEFGAVVGIEFSDFVPVILQNFFQADSAEQDFIPFGGVEVSGFDLKLGGGRCSSGRRIHPADDSRAWLQRSR